MPACCNLLQVLLDAKAGAVKDAIISTSTEATQEASLEDLLAKVVAKWAGVELSVIPYKDSKDVNILGSIDNVQVLQRLCYMQGNSAACVHMRAGCTPLLSSTVVFDKQSAALLQRPALTQTIPWGGVCHNSTNLLGVGFVVSCRLPLRTPWSQCRPSCRPALWQRYAARWRRWSASSTTSPKPWTNGCR